MLPNQFFVSHEFDIDKFYEKCSMNQDSLFFKLPAEIFSLILEHTSYRSLKNLYKTSKGLLGLNQCEQIKLLAQRLILEEVAPANATDFGKVFNFWNIPMPCPTAYNYAFVSGNGREVVASAEQWEATLKVGDSDTHNI